MVDLFQPEIKLFALQMTLFSALVIVSYYKFNKRGGYGTNHEAKLKKLKDKKWQAKT